VSYNESTWRYFKTAPNAGVLSGPDVFRGAAGSRPRGTWIQFDLQAKDGRIHAARFLAFACPHTIAVAAWVAEHAVGALEPRLPEAVPALSERFAVPIEKRGRLLLVEDAWLAAVNGALHG
jgi:NifU-like protein involved in Fe-S cluster formation